jgi:radical SAM protein with 4Fe4S-binding SPASM domain
MTPKTELAIAPYVDVVRFSIDGFTKETFDETRGVSFDKTYENVTRFLRNHPEIDIQVRMINLPDTQSEQADYKDYWNNIRPGCAVITELYDHPWESQTESLSATCKKVEDEAFVYVDGTMYLCPWDFGKRNPVGKVDMMTSPVDIWNNHKYAEYKKILGEGRRCDIELCSRCSAVFT